jgi:MinD superfamily P-loop ATPase
VVESIRGADFVLLVTEPTPFGLHDLKQVAGVVKELGIPTGVIVNRDGIGDKAVETYCAESGLPVLMRIPMDRQVAEGIARGQTLVEIRPEFGPALREMLEQIVQRGA